MCQCSRSTPLASIHQLHPTQSLTLVPSSPLSQTAPTYPDPVQLVSLPPISTHHEEDESEPEQQEPEPEQQELEPEQHEPDDERDKLNQQFKSCIRDFNKNILKWCTEYMPQKY